VVVSGSKLTWTHSYGSLRSKGPQCGWGYFGSPFLHQQGSLKECCKFPWQGAGWSFDHKCILGMEEPRKWPKLRAGEKIL